MSVNHYQHGLYTDLPLHQAFKNALFVLWLQSGDTWPHKSAPPKLWRKNLVIHWKTEMWELFSYSHICWRLFPLKQCYAATIFWSLTLCTQGRKTAVLINSMVQQKYNGAKKSSLKIKSRMNQFDLISHLSMLESFCLCLQPPKKKTSGDTINIMCVI